MPRASAIVVAHKQEEGGIKMKEAEEKMFEKVGHQVGTALLTRERVITT